MPDREKVIKYLQDAFEEAEVYGGALVDEETIRDALALLKEQEARWIPVTERLPEEKINPNTRDFEYVLCATVFGDVRPYKYGAPIGQGEAHFWNGAGYVDAYVTHWMPLPEPPKEES